MTGARRPLVRLLKFLGLSIPALALGILATLLLVLIYFPATLITPLAHYATGQQGLLLQDIRLGEPWLTRNENGHYVLAIESVALDSTDVAINVSALELLFDVTDALQGSFGELSLGELQLTTALGSEALLETQEALSQANALLAAQGAQPESGNERALNASQTSAQSDSKDPTASAIEEQSETAPSYLAQANALLITLAELPVASLSVSQLRINFIDKYAQTVTATFAAEALKSDRNKLAARFSASAFEHLEGQAIMLQGETELTLSGGALTFGVLEVALKSLTLPDAQLQVALSQLRLHCGSKSSCVAQARVSTSVKSTHDGLPALHFDNVALQELSADFSATLEQSDERLTLSINQFLASLDLPANGSASAMLSLEAPALSVELNDTIGADGSFTLRADELALPGLKQSSASLAGDFSLQQSLAELQLSLTLAEQAEPLIDLALSHSLAEANGSAELRFTAPVFTPESPLSSVLDLPALGFAAEGQDLLGGEASSEVAATWQQESSNAWVVDGDINLSLTNLSGFFTETLFVDATSELAAQFGYRFSKEEELSSSHQLSLRSVAPARLELESIDTGFVLQQASGVYEFTASTDFSDASYSVSARNLRARFLGGEIAMAALALNEQQRPESFDLVLSGVDLGAVMELASYPELVVEGRISGYVPVRLAAGQGNSAITVTKGLISALKPGGSIKYSPLTAATGNQSLQLVNQALANYQFNTLDTTLTIDESGEIDLGVVLAGANPEMNGGQAINLNVNISDNLIDLLESLRASRELTEELEQRLQR